jgi:AraC-like DNA-binding protein
MSKERQPKGTVSTEPAVRSYSVTHPAGLHLAERVYDDWGQLLFAERGAAIVRMPSEIRVLPRHRAIWIPPGVPVSIDVRKQVAFRTVYIRTDCFPSRLCSGVLEGNVRSLARELILETCRISTLSLTDERHSHLAHLIVDEVAALDASPFQLPLPSDPRSRAAIEYIIVNQAPGEERNISLIAKTTGASVRTLQRLFSRETGMGFGQWIRRYRLLSAAQLLSEGYTVSETGQRIGYRSISAFVAAFHGEFAVTPGRFVGKR